eukprot:scaffold2299_cov131-Cylindrotheca_fusiformis.AAC.40
MQKTIIPRSDGADGNKTSSVQIYGILVWKSCKSVRGWGQSNETRVLDTETVKATPPLPRPLPPTEMWPYWNVSRFLSSGETVETHFNDLRAQNSSTTERPNAACRQPFAYIALETQLLDAQYC